MDTEQKIKEKRKESRNWIRNISYLGGLATLIFIMVQAYFAGRSIIKSSEWEKAKMTIENIERFKENLKDSPINYDTWILGDKIWADFSTPSGRKLSDTLLIIYLSLFDNDEAKMFDDCIRMIDVMDAFAYPIIMGYASEAGSYQIVARQFHVYGNFIMPIAFGGTPMIGFHAKLLYKLWRIRYEILLIDRALMDNSFMFVLRERIDHLLCYERTDFSEASLKTYRRKLDRELKKMQREIEVFRKKSLK